MSTARLQTLADGVFAIVMTLLVFDIAVPGPDVDLEPALVDLLPNLISYGISFVILGVYWVGHHAQFQYIQRADMTLLWLNIAFLMAVALVPFSAGMLGRHGSEQISAVIYGANLIIVALAHFATWKYATGKRRLADPDLDAAIVALGTRLSLIPVGLYFVAIGLSFLGPEFSIVLYALVPVPYVTGVLYR